MMARLLGMFPHAHVYVDEREKDEYAPVVPAEQLFFHHSLPNQQHIRNWILRHEKAEAVVFCDDDLEYVVSHVSVWPQRRTYTDPESLRVFVENGVDILCDLDLHWYGWGNCAHPGGFSNCQPLSLTGVPMGIHILRGREFWFDEKTDNDDIDLTLQVLLRDRILIKDQRLFWYFGVTGGNPGGHQATQTNTNWQDNRAYMRRKWGKFFVVKESSGGGNLAGKKSSHKEGFGHSVGRKSPLVKNS